jgi:VanZ family protein
MWTSLALVAAIAALAYLGLVPAWVQVRGYDKPLHFLLVGSLAFWFVVAFGDRRAFGVPLAVVIPGALAGLEEALQTLSPRRSADWLDFACDVAGLLFFWWLACRWRDR